MPIIDQVRGRRLTQQQSELLSGLLLRPLVKRPFALDCRLERKPSAQSTAMQKIWVWKETTIETQMLPRASLVALQVEELSCRLEAHRLLQQLNS